MEQCVFEIVSLIIEGATEKVSQFLMPIKSFYEKCFNEQKSIFEHCQIVKTRNNIYFLNALPTFAEVPYISLFLYYKKMRGSIVTERGYKT